MELSYDNNIILRVSFKKIEKNIFKYINII